MFEFEVLKTHLTSKNRKNLHSKENSPFLILSFSLLEMAHVGPPQEVLRREFITSEETNQIITSLLFGCSWGSEGPILQRGRLANVARIYSRSEKSIKRIFLTMKGNYQTRGVLTCSPKKSTGRPQKWNREELREEIALLEWHKRGNMQSIAATLNIPLTTIHRLQHDNDYDLPIVLPHSSPLLPLLTDEHKVARFNYCYQMLSQEVDASFELGPTERYLFQDFTNHVHVDEKWFFITKQQWKLYLTPAEMKQNAAPKRRVVHKNHIMKVMFLSAVARPEYDRDTYEMTFDGKIGIWPIVEETEAQRTTQNREAGTKVTTPVSVTKTIYRELLLEKVIPAIKRKWPRGRTRNVIIQQDGASSHVAEDDEAVLQACNSGNWNMKLLTQPARSPDLNINDLSFFAALQAAQWARGCSNNMNEHIAMVEAAYNEFDEWKLEKAWVTMGTCMEKIIERQGDNDYNIPHIGKDKMIREGRLPRQWTLSERACKVINDVNLLELEQELEREVHELNDIEELTELLQQWEEEEAEDEQRVLQFCADEEAFELAEYMEEYLNNAST
jgi:hypothetical protein